MIEYLRYFEYGKYFSDKGTSEYQILDRSPDELEYFNHVVSRLFPYLQDPSRKTASSVTVALFPFEDEYIFIQIERRHEGEYLGKLENPSTSDRTFAQSRVVFLKREQINYYFDKSLPLYTGLLSGQNITKIYTRRGQVNHLPLPQGADLQMERYAFLQSGTLVAAIAEESKNSSNHWSVNVLTHQMDWKLKLKLVEDAQMVMWHEWGLFTFASDTFLLSTTNIHFLDELSSLERVDHQTTASDTFLLSTRNIHFFDELSSQERADHQTTKNIHILGKLQEANRPIGLISEINRLRQEVLHLSEEYKFHSPSFSNLTEYLELLGKYIYQYMDTLNDVILRSSENKYWEFYLHEIVEILKRLKEVKQYEKDSWDYQIESIIHDLTGNGSGLGRYFEEVGRYYDEVHRYYRDLYDKYRGSLDFREVLKQGSDSTKTYMSALATGDITLSNEAKLILVGEGEVGKTCLMDALLNNDWQEHSITHGVEIHQFAITDAQSKTKINLNGWDFGGQKEYRFTNQLFFSAPAVYLVVWKPREGSQVGQVKEWIELIKRRAIKQEKNDAYKQGVKILVVATHGGPQYQPDLNRQELWDLFGKEIIVDFFSVDSKPDEQGNRKGIEELKRAVARTAAELPGFGSPVPRNFADVRQTLQEKGVPYLSQQEVLSICRAHNMDDEFARLFITTSHRLGRLTHYENDPTLRDIVILRPDWLATAMSYVLDDEETRGKHGLVNFSRLQHLWNDSTRLAEDRYPEELHRVFLRLMERFDLSYRVADPYAKNDADPISLIGQLVPDVRPSNLSEAWGASPSIGDIQQIQICRIVDASNGQSANAEGLFYQLIVRLHKYSLGRIDYNASVHWQRGLVLEDEYKSRAFLEYIGNDVRITVRSPFPEGLLSTLTHEVKFLVESFWEGLRCDVMVPCIEPCGKNAPGTGLYNVSNLIESKRDGQPKYPCPTCNKWQDIDSLLRNAPAATKQISLAELQSEFAAIKDKLDDVNVTSRRILSQVDKTYTDLLQVLTDEAKEGPRLFSFFPVDRSNFNPKEWVRAKFRLVLWCEHSRLPLPALNGTDSKKGVYDLELDREWFRKSAPYLKFLTGTLGMVLPVASSAVKLALDETAYKLIEEQLDFGKSVIDAAIDTSGNVSEFMSKSDTTDLEHGVAVRSDGSTLRELHALLKAKDPGFGGLVRVMNKRQEFLWVHEKFAGEY